jgi:hypothetical protein
MALKVNNKSWIYYSDGNSISISVTVSDNHRIALVAVCGSSGLGSIFDATDLGVQCHLGLRGDGIAEAFAKSLMTITRCQRVILTISIRDLSSKVAHSILDEIKSHVTLVN